MPSPPPNSHLLSTYLADTDEFCPSCNYNLRGLATGVCPECNQPLCLSVTVREPRLAWFLVAVIGLSCGIGLTGFMIVLLILMVRNGNVGPSTLMGTLGLLFGSAFATLCGSLTTILAARRRFARFSRQLRAMIAVLACTLPPVFVAFVLWRYAD